MVMTTRCPARSVPAAAKPCRALRAGSSARPKNGAVVLPLVGARRNRSVCAEAAKVIATLPGDGTRSES